MPAEPTRPVTDHGPILVTGALGFVAARLLPGLLQRGARVVAVVRPGRDAGRLERAGIEVRRADLARADTGRAAAFAGAGAVVHLAGMSLVPGLVGELQAAGVRRGVFVSSAGVYTRLASSGAEAKRAGEAALRSSGLAWTVLRPSMIYGLPGDRNLERLLRWLSRSPIVPVPGRGRVLQQPVHVDDLVAALIGALERPGSAGHDYDVGGPEPLTLRALIEESARAAGRRAFVVPMPLRPVWTLVRAGRGMGLRLPVRPEQVLRLEESKAVDIGPARRDLGFDPRSFRDGIRAEVDLLGEGP